MRIFFVFNEGCFPSITIYRRPWGFRFAWKRSYPSARYAIAREWGYWHGKWCDREWVTLAGPCGFSERVE